MVERRIMLLGTMLLIGTSVGLAQQSVEIPASKDNTIFEEAGTLSNGAGQYIFCGKTAANVARRSLLAFDVAGAVPSGATITGATLTLRMSRTIVGAQTCGLHRVLADWGESTSDAGGNEGRGTQAADGDATWENTFYPDDDWTTMGGDFEPTASATASVSGIGAYTWSSADMVADVQGWLDDPAGNYGWLLMGDETVFPSAKRFGSRENGNAAHQPALLIEYDESVCVGDVNGDDEVNLEDLSVLLANYGTDDGASLEDGDLDGDGDVDLTDLSTLLGVYGTVCD